MTEETKNYGRLLEAVGEAKRDKDHVVLVIIEESGATCVNLCPREGTSNLDCSKAAARTLMKAYLDDEYDRNDYNNGRAVVALQDLTQSVVREFVCGDDEDDDET